MWHDLILCPTISFQFLSLLSHRIVFSSIYCHHILIPARRPYSGIENVLFLTLPHCPVGGVGMLALLLLSEKALGEASTYAVYIKVRNVLFGTFSSTLTLYLYFLLLLLLSYLMVLIYLFTHSEANSLFLTTIILDCTCFKMLLLSLTGCYVEYNI